MTLYASVEIFNLPNDIRFETAKEVTASEKDAVEQFNQLAKLISSMKSDSDSIVLETTEGYMLFNRKFFVDSVLRLCVTEEEEVE